MKIISQILGIVAFIFFLFSIQFKSKKKILTMQFISNIFYTSSYFLLKAYSAVIINIISLIRYFIYYHYERKNIKIPLISVYTLILITIIVSLFIVSNPFDLLPIIICIIYIIATSKKKIIAIQVGYIIAALIWIIYNLHIQTYTPLIGNIFEIISGTIAIIRLKKSY